MRPIDALKDNEIPILFMHGADDTYITPSHAKRLKDTTKGYSEIHLFPGAEHAKSMLSDPETYGKIVKNFLEKVRSFHPELW